MNEWRWTMLLLTVTGFVAGGCGGEKVPSLAKVHGKITYQGKPLTGGRVLFVPTKQGEGESRLYPASGDIKPDGTYELATNNPGDGAAIGEHKIVLNVFENPGKGAPSTGSMMKSLVPIKYADTATTPMTKNVAAGDNTIDIDLID